MSTAIRRLSRARALGALPGALSEAQAKNMIALIDEWSALLSDVRPSERTRVIVADDSVDALTGLLLYREAFAVIRGGSLNHFPVDSRSHEMAFDGRRLREFVSAWRRVRDAIGLKGDANQAPVSDLSAGDINDSLRRLAAARATLVSLPAPAPPAPPAQPGAQEKSRIWPWILAAAAAVVVIKKSRKP